MNTWKLTDEIRNKIKPIIIDYFEKVLSIDECDEVEDLDLTFKGISPYQLEELLKEMGYENTEFDSNGWQFDFWVYMTKKDDNSRLRRIIISGCGMSFSLKIQINDE